MSDEWPGTPDYTMGFGEEISKVFQKSSAVWNAAYLLPYLRPGLRVLDFGCGPGALSVGLAKAVDPGELHGIDMEESQIELARSVAEASGQENAAFHVGDVTDMPFADGFFDIAHCHMVLMHVPDTMTALIEVKRVLKPGGILACREMICASSFIHPGSSVMRNVTEVFEDLLEADDGHPQMGKDMKGHILAAGFENLRLTGMIDFYSTPKEIAFIYALLNEWLLSPEIVEAAIKYGAITRELCDRMRAAIERWKDDSGAIAGLAFGEAVASKP